VTAATDAQWEAYYAAKGRVHQAQAERLRAEAAACRVRPFLISSRERDANDYEEMAAECDRMAAAIAKATGGQP
jgi:hypothetical protein